MAKALFTRNGKVVFTRDYTHGWFIQTRVKQGDKGIITRVYLGVLDVSHVDIRLANGKFLREVPVEYLRT